MRVSATGIPWYESAEDYEAVRAISVDADGFCDTYEDWLSQAKQLERAIQAEGGRPIRVHMDAVDFPEWCQDRGANIDAHARSSFASEVAGQVITRERGM